MTYDPTPGAARKKQLFGLVQNNGTLTKLDSVRPRAFFYFQRSICFIASISFSKIRNKSTTDVENISISN